MKLVLAAAVALVAALLVFRSSRARGQTLEKFIASSKQTAAGLTDEKLTRFKIFWQTRSEFARRARPAVLAGLVDGGYTGAVSAAGAAGAASVFKTAEEAAASKSGLTVNDGMAIFMLVTTYYNGVYSATNAHDEVQLAAVRESFEMLHGAAALALVKRHEAEFLPLVTDQVEAMKADMRANGF